MSIYDGNINYGPAPANKGQKEYKWKPTKKADRSDWPKSIQKQAPANRNAAPNQPKTLKTQPSKPKAGKVSVWYSGKKGGGGAGIYDISRPIKNAGKNYMKPEHLK